jgi:hypothetical protein
MSDIDSAASARRRLLRAQANIRVPAGIEIARV